MYLSLTFLCVLQRFSSCSASLPDWHGLLVPRGSPYLNKTKSTMGLACVPQQDEVDYGVGLRFRGLFVPQSLFERFVEIAPSGISKPELGLEVIRRRRNFEAVFGLAWANISAEDGIWVDDFDDVDDNPSFIEFDGFSWITFDINAVWKRSFNPQVALRYGFGIGLGVLMGDILETDYVCPGNRYDLESCGQSSDATAVRKPLDLPPVLPLMNALLGIQYSPSDQVSINLDGGLHTTLFVGLSVDFFFPR